MNETIKPGDIVRYIGTLPRFPKNAIGTVQDVDEREWGKAALVDFGGDIEAWWFYLPSLEPVTDDTPTERLTSFDEAMSAPVAPDTEKTIRFGTLVRVTVNGTGLVNCPGVAIAMDTSSQYIIAFDDGSISMFKRSEITVDAPPAAPDVAALMEKIDALERLNMRLHSIIAAIQMRTVVHHHELMEAAIDDIRRLANEALSEYTAAMRKGKRS